MRIFRLGRVTPLPATMVLYVSACGKTESFIPVGTCSLGAFLVLLNVQAPLGVGKGQLMYTAPEMGRPELP